MRVRPRKTASAGAFRTMVIFPVFDSGSRRRPRSTVDVFPLEVQNSDGQYIDLKGMTLMPSLMDAHVHATALSASGKALSPTAGHGDMRMVSQNAQDAGYAPSLGRICNGISEAQAAARDEIRRGANHIKIMANGGIAGRLRKGYHADLIAFEGDPVRDVRLSAQLNSRLRLVIRGGVVDSSRLP